MVNFPAGILDGILGPVVKTVVADVGLCGTGLLKRVKSGYEPRTGTAVVSDKSQWVIHITPPQAANITELGNVISRGFRTFVSADELTALGAPAPTIDMRLQLPDGNEYRIVTVDPVYSGNLICGYNLSCAT